ncbi:transcriptional regulator [Candidatus Poriferisodalis sp.]|uniref:transcriptional regulator n=1 Tax=Candidatus Poriferisodalis sp. TaxID=3101277 RepID=UPI003B011219
MSTPHRSESDASGPHRSESDASGPHRSEPRLLVWLALRLKGLGEIDDVAAIHGLEPDDTEWLLAELDAAGHCMFREVGGVPKFILTPTGRDDGETALAAELDAAGARDAVTAAYRDFLALNPKMLQLCTDWQVLPEDHPAVADAGPGDGGRLNDHGDPDYDAAVISRLDDLHGELGGVLDQLCSVMARYDNYAPRFAEALSRLQDGELDYLTKPMMPSYHTVWFELHEDLLATLGINRADEGSV